MAFNTVTYILFFALVLILNVLLPSRFRIYLILFASFTFIAFKNVESLLVLLFLSSITFVLSKRISSASSPNIRKGLFYSGIALNGLSIFLFKYFESNSSGFSFSVSAINFDAGSFIFALGLSFYALQNISYLTERYYNRLKAEITWTQFTFYASFFPKLVSGPISLPQEVLPQIGNNRILQADIIGGAQRIILGLVKKMVIADRLAPYVHYNFDINESNYGLTALTATYFFTIQLYFDFSGYTDIALGSAKMLGYNLKENFQFPLRAASITEFWRKWHISLTSWLTQYVYYPVAYKYRKLKVKGTLIAIIITLIISGIWHGIGLTFFIYAVCHAVYLSIELLTKNYRVNLAQFIPVKVFQFLGIIITFNLSSFSFIFFRAGSFEKSMQILKSIFSLHQFWPDNWLNDFVSKLAIGGDQEAQFNLFITLMLATLFLIFEKRIQKAGVSEKVNWKFLVSSFVLILLFGIFKSREQFIYIQF